MLESLGLFAEHIKIAFYLANDGEIDPGLAMQCAVEKGVHCFLPIIPLQGERRLGFGEVNATTSFQPNRFGIPEPCTEAADIHLAEQLDWVLVPLVAFDECGSRVGMGGGFYDTTLGASAELGPTGKPEVAGLAHELQKVSTIPSDSWDIPISRIVTESTAYQCLK